MNMKKYLLISLAALGFAACNQSDDIDSPAHNGEVEESYIAISLMSADKNGTRAITDDPYGNADQYGYEDGTDEERAIKSAYFFFFDEAGNPFNLLGAPATAPGGEKNHLSLTIEGTTGKTAPNVSDIKKAVLVLNTYKGVYPKLIVAVLNWTPQGKAYSLGDLHNELSELRVVENSFVMSNSVYMSENGQNIMDAVAISEADIKTTSDDAMGDPIDIYVERIAAKVVLTASGKVAETDNIFKVTNKDNNPESAFKPVGQTEGIDVYMKLHGWELYNDYSTSYLLKNIRNWGITDLGLTWNDIPYFRSYWAESQKTDHNDEFAWEYVKDGESVDTYGGFPTQYGFSVASINSETNAVNYTTGTYTYCGENTNQKNVDSDPRTKVILKGQLMQATTEPEYPDGYKPLEIASWYGNDYAGLEDLKIAVANSLKYTLVYKDGDSYTGIKPEDLQCVRGGDYEKEAYQVVFQLSTADDCGVNKEWYTKSSAGGEQILGSIDSEGPNNKDATNAYLIANVEPALLYENGMTYYFVDIEHLGTAGAKYGVVRNHVYQIDIESIKGFGSPIYIGTGNIITPPEYPEDYEDAYVAARINVLSWKVVKQGVNIQP